MTDTHTVFRFLLKSIIYDRFKMQDFTLHCNNTSLPTVQLKENNERRGYPQAPALASAINYLLLGFSTSFYFKATVDYLLVFTGICLFIVSFFGKTKTREKFKNLVFFYIKTNLKYLTNIRKKI